MKNKKYKYMHTIQGLPADFKSGKQITYGGKYVHLYDDLKTIRTHQKKSNEWRKQQGFTECSAEYHHKKVILE